VLYKGLKLNCGYKLDLIVQDEIILELKSVEKLLPVHEAQLLTYLRLPGKKVGLLINFNVPLLTQGLSGEFFRLSLVFSVPPCLRGELVL